MSKYPIVLLPDGQRACRVCGDRPVLQATAARCERCIEEALRRSCPDCGASIGRRSVRCRECAASVRSVSAWAGGRSITNKGYVLVRADMRRVGGDDHRGHPRVQKNGYILEHILVMEAMLGRHLLPGENVHHKNGKRDDNRPENLELWVTKQPLGQRPADLLAWAYEVIERYGP